MSLDLSEFDVDIENINKNEKELEKYPEKIFDGVKVVTAKEVYDKIVKNGGSYDIEGGLETLRKMVEEEERIKKKYE